MKAYTFVLNKGFFKGFVVSQPLSGIAKHPFISMGGSSMDGRSRILFNDEKPPTTKFDFWGGDNKKSEIVYDMEFFKIRIANPNVEHLIIRKNSSEDNFIVILLPEFTDFLIDPKTSGAGYIFVADSNMKKLAVLPKDAEEIIQIVYKNKIVHSFTPVSLIEEPLK